MGNIISLDMGIVMLRCTIFDKNDRLKFLLPSKETEEKKEKFKIGDSLSEDGFAHSLTFKSKVHDGTFYFLQFNILRTTEVFFILLLSYSFLKVMHLKFFLNSSKQI